MKLRHLTRPNESIEVPRWLAECGDLRALDGKRVFAETGGAKHHAVDVGLVRIHGPNQLGHFAADLEFPHYRSSRLPRGYIYHLSGEQLHRLTPATSATYDLRYVGVLYPDHPFTASFDAASKA